jgi:hypothetical protein
MTKETPVKTEAVNLCRRFPTLPARTLARMLNRDFPQLYPTVERARCTVRDVMGLRGPSNLRKSVADIVRPKRNAGEWEGVPVGSREIDWRTFDVDGKSKCLVLSDIHIPFPFPSTNSIASGKTPPLHPNSHLLRDNASGRSLVLLLLYS